MFKVNNKDTRTTPSLLFDIFGIFIVNFEHISHLVPVLLLLTLSRWMLAGHLPKNKIFIKIVWFVQISGKTFPMEGFSVYFG